MDFPLENPNLKWMKFIGTPMKRTAPNSDTEKPGRFVMQQQAMGHGSNGTLVPCCSPQHHWDFSYPSPTKTGWWLTYPSEKTERQLG